MSRRNPHTLLRVSVTGGLFVLLCLAFVSVTAAVTCPRASAAEEIVELWRGGGSQVLAPFAVAVNPVNGRCWVSDCGRSQMLLFDSDGTELRRVTIGASVWMLVSVAVNSQDGSCWVGCYTQSGNDFVVHISVDGTELSRSFGFLCPWSVSVNEADGSCWVVDLYHRQVVHLAPNGSELQRLGGLVSPYSVSVSPTDGSCWVADPSANQIVRLSATGAEVWRGSGFNQPMMARVNPNDGSCWVADTANNQVVHLRADGVELWRGGGFALPRVLAVDASSGYCWVACNGGGGVACLAANGAELWRRTGMLIVGDISAANGSAWLSEWYRDQVLRMRADGSEAWRSEPGFAQPSCVSVNETDGSCWVGDPHTQIGYADFGCVAHLAEDGTVLWRGSDFALPLGVSINPADGSCWVADCASSRCRAVRLGADGAELASISNLYYAYAIATDPTDGSCWVYGMTDVQAIFHFAADGSELARNESVYNVQSSSVNPADSTCWVADGSARQVVHLAPDASELWRGGVFTRWPRVVCANPNDGSCWVADTYGGEVVHLAEDGSELWRSSSGFVWPYALSVDHRDNSCWVADMGSDQVIHIAADGTELGRVGGFNDPVSVSVNQADGTCWVADQMNHEVVHLMGINSPPVAADDSATTAEDSAVSIAVLGNDSDPDADPLTIDSITQPAHGTATINGEAVDYVPAQDYNGSDSFTYTVSDGNGETATASVNLIVSPVNDPPVAVDDVATTPEDTPITITVLANDYDVEGDSIVVDSVTQPAHGTATRNPDGTVVYAPSENFTGEDFFTYTISDVTQPEQPEQPPDGGGGETPPPDGGGGGETPPPPDEPGPAAAAAGAGLLGASQGVSNVGTVTITVTSVNDPPAAAFSYAPASPTNFDPVSFSDGSADPDGSVAAWAWDFGDGTTSSAQNPSHQYAAAGTYTVTLTVTDNEGGTGATTHQLTIGYGGNTAPGGNVPVNPGAGVSITFAQVTSGGETTVTTSSSPPHGPPTGFRFLGAYYDISTTADYVAPITMRIAYDPSGMSPAQEAQLKIFHEKQPSGWEDVTVSVDTVNHVIVGQVNSLSWFALGYPAGYTWLGFLPPVGDADGRPFKKGSTIPVKFRIAGANGAPVTGAVANLSVSYLTAGAPSGEAEVASTAAGDWGTQFRYSADGDLYIFNLSTKGSSYLAPFTYRARVTLDDGSTHEVEFSLK